MPDQTPEPLTDDRLRLWGEFATWADAELRTARARITELEAERDIAQGQWRLSSGEALTARDDLDKARARITEWRVHFAEIVDALGLPEDTRFDCLPVEAREARSRITELEAAQSDPAGYVVVTRNAEGGVHRSATAWDSLEQANTAEGIASGYADGTGCTAAVYELREVQR